VARDLALQQLESPQLKRRAKRNTDPILVKPSAGPVLGPKVKTNLDDVAIKVLMLQTLGVSDLLTDLCKS
jgi:hypothetical protein